MAVFPAHCNVECKENKIDCSVIKNYVGGIEPLQVSGLQAAQLLGCHLLLS